MLWTRTALSQLEAVHAFWCRQAPPAVAGRIVLGIHSRAIRLRNPFDTGMPEGTGEYRALPCRYVLWRHWTILFRQEGNVVYVVGVFDTRRRPPDPAAVGEPAMAHFA